MRITRDDELVGTLATLTLVPGALAAVNVDPQSLMTDAVLTFPNEVLPKSALDMSIIGSTLIACTRGWGIPDCAWFQDGTLRVFNGAFMPSGHGLAERFLQDYLGRSPTIPTP